MCDGGVATEDSIQLHPRIRRMAPLAPDRYPVASAAGRGSGAHRRSTSSSQRHQEVAAPIRRRRGRLPGTRHSTGGSRSMREPAVRQD